MWNHISIQQCLRDIDSEVAGNGCFSRQTKVPLGSAATQDNQWPLWALIRTSAGRGRLELLRGMAGVRLAVWHPR